MKLDIKIAWAAATDAANRNCRKEGRIKWNGSDYAVACKILLKLWPIENDIETWPIENDIETEKEV